MSKGPLPYYFEKDWRKMNPTRLTMHLVNLSESYEWGCSKPTEAEIEDMNASIMVGQDPFALASVLDALADLDVSEESLSDNSVPTLILVGENALERSSAEEMAKIMNKATLFLVRDADHAQVVQADRPEVGRAILNFLGTGRTN